MPSHWTIVTLSISFIALIIAILNFRRKSSLNLRAYFLCTSASIYTKDSYVSSLFIENMKDRAVTIFHIYLKIGWNYYIEIENFEANPLIIKAFESWRKDYDAIESYYVNHEKISIDNLLNDRKIRKRIVLSTSDGKYTIKKSPKRWNPIDDFFKNHETAIIYPIQAQYKNKTIGGMASYVIDMEFDKSPNQIMIIHRTDYQLQMFQNFRFTKESLENTDALNIYLQQQVELGNLPCKSFKVLDVEKWRASTRINYKTPPITAKYINFFQYYIIGRIRTFIADKTMR